jgi:hypothetical protein
MALEFKGREGLLRVKTTDNQREFLVPVKVVEVRPIFGRYDLAVTPIIPKRLAAISGPQTVIIVNSDRVSF